MTGYVALFRGINVGGRNRVKMNDLRGMFLDLGLGQVRTYVQSGNVLFESEETEDLLRERIEHQSERTLGLKTSVILRTFQELSGLIRDLPFSPDDIDRTEASSKVESLYVALLARPPGAAEWQGLLALKQAGEECQKAGRDVYLLLPQGIRGSRSANNLDRLGVPLTMRNWNTLKALHAMTEATTER
ncbi:MAG: DUF1697 domain-containing protein [Methanomassiliicoccus sp.]|nr:DUF1697 domain-containing protein [Methanomassiliicoccus sp.]